MKDILLVYAQIHRYPFDLSIAITTDETKFGFIITRGEGGNFSPLVVLHPCFDIIEQATRSVVELLINIVETTQTFADVGEILPPLLTMDLIADIQTALQIHHIANTWDMAVTA